MGGLVELYARWKSYLLSDTSFGYDDSKLATQADVDFGAATPLPAPGGATPDSKYRANRELEPLACFGGNSTTSCAASFAAWDDSLKADPVLLDFGLAPISDLVEDPTVKAAMESAAKAYIAQRQAAWVATGKCPGGCNGHGACSTAGKGSCDCAKCWKGRACSLNRVTLSWSVNDQSSPTHSGSQDVECGAVANVWTGVASGKYDDDDDDNNRRLRRRRRLLSPRRRLLGLHHHSYPIENQEGCACKIGADGSVTAQLSCAVNFDKSQENEAYGVDCCAPDEKVNPASTVPDEDEDVTEASAAAAYMYMYGKKTGNDPQQMLCNDRKKDRSYAFAGSTASSGCSKFTPASGHTCECCVSDVGR